MLTTFRKAGDKFVKGKKGADDDGARPPRPLRPPPSNAPTSERSSALREDVLRAPVKTKCFFKSFFVQDKNVC